MDNAIEITGLTKRYRDFSLNDISLVIPRGYIMGLIGPNGSGKTTLIKLIMNLIKREAGEIRIFGEDNRTAEARVKARIGFVYDEPCFHEDSRLSEIKRAISPFYEKWDENLFQRLMGEFELPQKKVFKKLSQGMKVKFALALALSHHADLLVMDEPTAGLDPVFRRQLLRKLSEVLQDEGKTILFSTHVTSDLERIADYITFIYEGTLLFSLPKDELLEKWGIVKGTAELLNGNHRDFFQGFRRNAFGVEALTSDVAEAQRRFGRDVVVNKASFEDIMYFMTRGNRHD